MRRTLTRRSLHRLRSTYAAVFFEECLEGNEARKNATLLCVLREADFLQMSNESLRSFDTKNLAVL